MEQMIHYALETLTLLAAGLCLLKCRVLAAEVSAAKLAAERSKSAPEAMIFRPGGKRA